MSRLTRRLLTLVVATALLATGAAPARAETLTDLAKRLVELRKRVALWIDLVERDQDNDKIARYKAQQAEDFRRKGKDFVSASDLFEIVLNKEKPDKSVRLAAGKALEDAAVKNIDPELQGPKRAKFAKDKLIPYLTKPEAKGGDRWIRDICDKILNMWFKPGGRNVAPISQYNPDVEKTWGAAATAWRDVIKDS